MEIKEISELNRFTFFAASCPICGSNDSVPRLVSKKFDQGDLTFVTCRHCETVYQNPCPDARSMRDFYISQNFFVAKQGKTKFVGYMDYDAEEETRQRNAVYRLKEIETLFPHKKKLKILKIACGYGTLVKQALDAGHDAKGIDFSEVMVAGAKKRYGIDLIHSAFLDHDFGDEKFDCVILYGAINNLLDVMKIGGKINDILVPGGVYLSNFVEPNSIVEKIQGSNFWLYRPPIIGLWTAKSFIEHHVKFGMELVEHRPDVQWVSIGKLVGYIQWGGLLQVLVALGIHKWFVKIPTPGYAKVILRRPTAKA